MQVAPTVCIACSAGIRHDLCTPPCSCLQCHMRHVEDGARAHLALPQGRPGREAALANDVACLLSLSDQRRQRRLRLRKAPRAPFPCECGRITPDGPCMVTDAAMRTRRFRSRACEQYARRRRRMIANRAEMMLNAAGQTPPAWNEHWSQTT
jgi:hypothetical protein